VKDLILFLITLYQKFSAMGTPHCRFYPSCSHYTYEAIERYGAMKGTWMGILRLCRCHPFHAGGHDPVP
jgi:putative membrane protein insertion efficiency factor